MFHNHAIMAQFLDSVVQDTVNKLATAGGAEILGQLDILVERHRTGYLVKGAQLGQCRQHDDAVQDVPDAFQNEISACDSHGKEMPCLRKPLHGGKIACLINGIHADIGDDHDGTQHESRQTADEPENGADGFRDPHIDHVQRDQAIQVIENGHAQKCHPHEKKTAELCAGAEKSEP